MSSEALLTRGARQTLLSEGLFYNETAGYISIPRASYSSSSDVSQDELVSLPAVLDSVQTLEWMGFTEEKAQSIFEEWSRAYEKDENVDFFRTAKNSVYKGYDAFEVTDDWPGAIQSMGMTKAFRKRIMRQEFNDIRLTGTAQYWVLETLRDMYSFLVSVPGQITSKGSHGGFVSLKSRLDTGSAGKKGKNRAQGSEMGQDSQKRTLLTTTSEFHVKEDEIILYKGGALVRLRKAANTPGDPSKIALGNLVSSAPTDFEDSGFSLYFTKHRELADQFAAYAAARLHEGKHQEVGVLNLVIPKSALASTVEIYDSHWKEFVWRMRLQRALDLPEYLQVYSKADILFGAMLQTCTEKVVKIEGNGGNYTHLQPCKLRNGNKGSQYCFRNKEQVKELSKVARFWIDEVVLDPKGASSDVLCLTLTAVDPEANAESGEAGTSMEGTKGAGKEKGDKKKGK